MQTPGPWVGHYTTAAITLEHIIPSGELRMSPRRSMRDPIENTFLVPGTAYWVDDQPHPEADWGRAVEFCKGVWERVRVLSLTRDVIGYEGNAVRFGCCWARARLWEQYADDHRGACLIFDRDSLERAITADLGARVTFGEVDYSAGGITMTDADMLIDPRIFSDDTREQAALDYIKTYEQELFFLKTDEWQSEHELRAVPHDAGDEYAFARFGDALRAVVIGHEFPDDQVAGANALAREHGVELKQARWEQGLPWLTSAT